MLLPTFIFYNNHSSEQLLHPTVRDGFFCPFPFKGGKKYVGQLNLMLGWRN